MSKRHVHGRGCGQRDEKQSWPAELERRWHTARYADIHVKTEAAARLPRAGPKRWSQAPIVRARQIVSRLLVRRIVGSSDDVLIEYAREVNSLSLTGPLRLPLGAGSCLPRSILPGAPHLQIRKRRRPADEHEPIERLKARDKTQ